MGFCTNGHLRHRLAVWSMTRSWVAATSSSTPKKIRFALRRFHVFSWQPDNDHGHDHGHMAEQGLDFKGWWR